jgi:hypothetical protein
LLRVRLLFLYGRRLQVEEAVVVGEVLVQVGGSRGA